jgi:nuclear pore complex protein Nup107
MLGNSSQRDVQMADSDEPAQSIEFNAPLDPLRSMADRVGNEVEAFAVMVDQFINRNKNPDYDPYHSSIQLVTDLKDVASKTVEDLARNHGPEAVETLRQTIARRVHGVEREDDTGSNKENVNDDGPPTVEHLRHWQQEADTWALLEMMLSLGYDDAAKTQQQQKQTRLLELGRVSKRTPDAEIWERFLLESEGAMEKERVLRWLEITADASPGDIDDIVEQLEIEAGHGSSIWSQGWLYTREKIKREKRTRVWEAPLGASRGQTSNLRNSENTENLVTQLDPDAPTRQQRTLESQDKFYERSVWLTIWEMLRRGKAWDEIREWCHDKNESWRAVSMGIVSSETPAARTWVGGIKAGSLWRMVCNAASQKKGEDEYQQAIYGLLGGNVKAVEPVCRSSDDYLYAHYQASLLKQFDRYLRTHFPNEVPNNLSGSLSRSFGRGSLGGEDFDVQSLMAELQSKWMTRAELASPFKAIQNAAISHHLLDLIEKIGRQLDEDAPAPEAAINNAKDDPLSIRVVAHIAIILKGLGCDFGLPRSSRRQALERVIVEHIGNLMDAGKRDAVPVYVALLSEQRGWETLAKHLTEVKEENEQVKLLRLMGEYDLNIGKILSYQYQHAIAASGIYEKDAVGGMHLNTVDKLGYLAEDSSVQWPGQAIQQPDPEADITEAEDAIIRSIEWYKHVPAMWCETFDGINQALIQFLRK